MQSEFVDKLVERLEENGQKMCEAKLSVPFGKHSPANHRYYKAISVKKAKFIIKQLTEEYNNGWIPCGDKLPEEWEDYLVSDGQRTFIAEYADYEWREHFDGTENYCCVDVLAWQPLPESYQPKGE